MARYICADTLIEYLVDDYCADCSKCGGNCRHDELFSIIDAQPTAYNVDAVVADIEDFREEAEQFGFASALSDIVEVVRKGGVE